MEIVVIAGERSTPRKSFAPEGRKLCLWRNNAWRIPVTRAGSVLEAGQGIVLQIHRITPSRTIETDFPSLFPLWLVLELPRWLLIIIGKCRLVVVVDI
jgi:hypothetical protein